jgi:ABC-type sugar transport system ATPase subunit
LSAAASPILDLRSINKSFGAVRALISVSFSLYPAEVVGLVGDNGAGKSTLSNIISGTLQPDAGEIFVDGVLHRFESAHDARFAGIETVFQTLAVAPTLDIAENVYLGREMLKRGLSGRWFRSMDTAAMRKSVAEGFRRLGLTLPGLGTKVGALSGGQRQAVAIARAVIWGSKIVVLDEPTAALGVKQTEIVLSFIERLKHHGVAVIFISHNMQHVMRVADRIFVLRRGRKAFDGVKSGLTAMQLVALMTGAATETAQ